jgi:hypothetical protein
MAEHFAAATFSHTLLLCSAVKAKAATPVKAPANNVRTPAPASRTVTMAEGEENSVSSSPSETDAVLATAFPGAVADLSDAPANSLAAGGPPVNSFEADLCYVLSPHFSFWHTGSSGDWILEARMGAGNDAARVCFRSPASSNGWVDVGVDYGERRRQTTLWSSGALSSGSLNATEFEGHSGVVRHVGPPFPASTVLGNWTITISGLRMVLQNADDSDPALVIGNILTGEGTTARDGRTFLDAHRIVGTPD